MWTKINQQELKFHCDEEIQWWRWQSREDLGKVLAKPLEQSGCIAAVVGMVGEVMDVSPLWVPVLKVCSQVSSVKKTAGWRTDCPPHWGWGQAGTHCHLSVCCYCSPLDIRDEAAWPLVCLIKHSQHPLSLSIIGKGILGIKISSSPTDTGQTAAIAINECLETWDTKTIQRNTWL